MNKRQAKRLARIYAAEIIRNAVSSGAVESIDGISDKDKSRVYDAMDELIESIGNTIDSIEVIATLAEFPPQSPE